MRAQRPPETFELHLDARVVTGLIVGSLVTLSAVFALGVGFGRRLAESPTLEPAPAPLAHLDALQDAPPQRFAFGELLSTPDPTPKPPPKPVVVARPPPPPPPPTPAPEPDPEPPPAPVVEVEIEPEPIAAALPEPPPPPPIPEPEAEPVSAATPQPSGRRWSVQFGASQDRGEADRLAASLLDHGLTPFVVVADIPGKGTFYRVRVGRFDDKTQADRLLSKATKDGLSGLVMPAD